MGGYTKNVAVLRGLKEGFSADGGALSGLVRAEKYGSELRVEVSLINFAPLSEGRYVTAITDGNCCEIIENNLFEGVSQVDTGGGFAAAVCYVNGGVQLIATAVCGDFSGEALALRDAVVRAEKIKNENLSEAGEAYDDGAIAEENYYEFAEIDEDGGAVCQDAPQKEELSGGEDEENSRPLQDARVGFEGDRLTSDNSAIDKSTIDDPTGKKSTIDDLASKKTTANGLAGGDFYEKMRGEIEGLLSAYPPEESLNGAISGATFVRIGYGDGKFYAFGIIRDGSKPAYICYGAPAADNSPPPESMADIASFLPVPSGNFKGFWMIYQDASTGATVKVIPS